MSSISSPRSRSKAINPGRAVKKGKSLFYSIEAGSFADKPAALEALDQAYREANHPHDRADAWIALDDFVQKHERDHTPTLEAAREKLNQWAPKARVEMQAIVDERKFGRPYIVTCEKGLQRLTHYAADGADRTEKLQRAKPVRKRQFDPVEFAFKKNAGRDLTSEDVKYFLRVTRYRF